MPLCSRIAYSGNPVNPLNTLLLVIAFLILQGCSATNNASTVKTLSTNINNDTKVLLMPLDVELSLLTASGMTELNAEWTENAKTYMKSAIETRLSEKDLVLMDYNSPTDDVASTNVQLEKLHQAIGYNVLLHHFGPVALPSKQKKFDWTMGESASLLKQQTGADYAMFVFVRDSYATGGRLAMQIGLALLNVHVQGGTQIGFASLVDLNTGDLVWFNRLISTSGDLREEPPATKTVANLLDTLPAPQ